MRLVATQFGAGWIKVHTVDIGSRHIKVHELFDSSFQRQVEMLSDLDSNNWNRVCVD